MTQTDINGRRGRWIAKILEFDLEIKTTKLVKGQGLAKLLVDSNYKVLGINLVSEISSGENPQEPSLISGENPQEPPPLKEGENPQEPLSSNQAILVHIDQKYLLFDWYSDIVLFLRDFQCPADISLKQFKALKLKAVKYCIINVNLY